MPMTALTGTRLRERRLAMGLRQAEVAKAAGVSASYLNLIEHNRRRATGDVLAALAQVLEVPVAALAEGAGSTLIEDLRVAAASAGEGLRAEVDRVEDFAGRFPGWAAAVVALQRRGAGLERALEAMNDRMSHDPHLSASLHEVLSSLSSVRSTAAILAETEDIDPEWRERFHRNLHVDSERLAAGAEALVAYLDGSDMADEQGILSPQEELEAWLAERGWHLPELEPGGAGAAVVQAEVAALASGAARVLARDWLDRAARDAVLLPGAALAEARAALGGDPLRIAASFGVEVGVVFRRLAVMPGSRAGLVVCDASGTMVFRKPAEGFALPRFGSACPLWPIYTALGRPSGAVLAEVQTAGRGGRRFRTVSYCAVRYPDGAGGAELREASMLIEPMAAGEAGGTMGGAVQVVGPTCRICLREGCAARREPSILTAGGEGGIIPLAF